MVIRWTDDNDVEPKPPSMIRAAQYVRMSTEHQQYSTDNQAATIAIYAQKRGLEIVKTYADEGKSGLNIKGRPALQALLDDIESGRADFKVLLVYDVSRWGRFQDPDEAASYELRCRTKGVGQWNHVTTASRLSPVRSNLAVCAARPAPVFRYQP